MAELCGQLGYPASTREMTKRLSFVLRHKNGACFVAEMNPGCTIAGWIHVSTTPLLEVERRAEMNGIIVDENSRSKGTGWLLMEAAEEWARKHGCKSMSVRSNVVRERAHAFYERCGYEHYKTQKAFRKKL